MDAFSTIDYTTKTGYLKFRIGANNDLFNTTAGEIEIKQIPTRVVQWLVESFPSATIDPDVWTRNGAVFKFLPTGTCAAPTITYASFNEELTAWFTDYIRQIEDRDDDPMSTNPAVILQQKHTFHHNVASKIDDFYDKLLTLDLAWFQPSDAEITPGLPSFFLDDDDTFRAKQEDRSTIADAIDAVGTADPDKDDWDILDRLDDMPEIGGLSLDTFESFYNDERYKVANDMKEAFKNRAVRHEVPEGWIKGRVGNFTYYAHQDGRIQYHSPLSKPTAEQAKLIEADPEAAEVTSKLKEILLRLYITLTGESLDVTSKSIHELLKDVNECIPEGGESPVALAAARKRYDETVAAAQAKKQAKAEAKQTDKDTAKSILDVVNKIEALMASTTDLSEEDQEKAQTEIEEILKSHGWNDDLFEQKGAGRRTNEALHQARMLKTRLIGAKYRLKTSKLIKAKLNKKVLEIVG